MADYTALIAAWTSTTQPPPGVTGAPLSTANTLAQNIAIVDAWTITGAVPTVLYATGTQLANCINYAEFKALTATQQANLLALCGIPGLLLGGSANVAFLADGMILDYFTNHSGPTILALTALAQSIATPWWQSVGLTSAPNIYDIQAAGLTNTPVG
jgi:hypothetical protein